MSLYNLKSTADPKVFSITKFDEDLNHESTYLVSKHSCNCPAGENDKRCRHQKMLPQFIAGKTIRTDTSWYYDFDNDQWYEYPHDGQDNNGELEPARPARSHQVQFRGYD